MYEHVFTIVSDSEIDENERWKIIKALEIEYTYYLGLNHHVILSDINLPYFLKD